MPETWRNGNYFSAYIALAFWSISTPSFDDDFCREDDLNKRRSNLGCGYVACYQPRFSRLLDLQEVNALANRSRGCTMCFWG